MTTTKVLKKCPCRSLSVILLVFLGLLLLGGCSSDSSSDSNSNGGSTSNKSIRISGIVKNFKDGQPVSGAMISLHEVNSDGTLGAQVGSSPYYTAQDGCFRIEQALAGSFYAIWARSPVLPSPNQIYYYRYYSADTNEIVLEIGESPPSEKASAGSSYLEIRNESGSLFQEDDTITVSDVYGGEDIMTATTCGKDFLVVRESEASDGQGLKDEPVGIGTHQIFVNGDTYTVYVGHANWADGTPPFVSTVLSLGPDLGSGLPAITVSGIVQNFKDNLPVEEAVVSVHHVNSDGTLGVQVGDSPFYTGSDGLFTIGNVESHTFYAIWVRSPNLPSPNHLYYYRYFDEDTSGLVLEIGSDPPVEKASAGSGYLEIRNGAGDLFQEGDTITVSDVCEGEDIMTAATCGKDFLVVREFGDSDAQGLKDDPVGIGTHQIFVNGDTYTVYVGHANWADGTPPFVSTVLSLGPDLGSG